MPKRKNQLKKTHEAELASYLRYKQRVFENEADVSDTDSSVSEGDVKRRRKLDCFGGNGVKKWDPQSIAALYQRSECHKTPLKFRNRNIILAEEINTINSIRLLSLSHIFAVDKFDKSQCISFYCSSLQNVLHEYAYDKIHFPKVSMEAFYYCKQLTDAIDENIDVDGIVYNPTNSIDIHVKKIALEFIDVAAVANESSESFMDRFILPFIKPFLKKSNLIYSLIDGHDSNSSKKPDLMIGFKDKKRIIYCIYFEVKRPAISSKYQAENDYVKLLKQLKDSINHQIQFNIASPVALGVHCEGFDCSLISMKIIEDGIYLATTLKKFKLPKDSSSLSDLPRAVECVEFMLSELQGLRFRYEKRQKSEVTIEH